MELHASLLNTQHYKVWIKGKWSNSEKEIAPYLSVVAIEKGASGLPSTMVSQLTYLWFPYIVFRICLTKKKNDKNMWNS